MQLLEWSLEQSLRCGLGAEVPSYLCGIDGAYAQKAFSCQVLFSTKENTFGVGFTIRRPPAKQQGPGSQTAQTLFGLWRPEG